MSDFRRDRFNLGILDPALEQLGQGQDAVAAGLQQRDTRMREDRNAGISNIQQMISEGDQAAAQLDPNDPEDAQALEAWQTEKATLLERVSSMTGPDVLNASLGMGGGEALSTIRQRSVAAQRAREDEVAVRDTRLQEQVIRTQGGVDLKLQSAGYAAQEALQANQLQFTGDQNERDRQFQQAMRDAEQAWRSMEAELGRGFEADQAALNRALEDSLTRAGFQFQGDQNAKDRVLARMRLALERDLGEAGIGIEQQRLNQEHRNDAMEDLIETAREVRTITDPDEYETRLAELESAVRSYGPYLLEGDAQYLASVARLNESASARLANAQVAETEGRAAALEGQAYAEAVNTAIAAGEYVAEVGQRASDAAESGQPWRVREALAAAQAIINAPEGSHPPEARQAAQGLLDQREALLDRAEEVRTQVTEAETLAAAQLRNQVAEGAITADAARRQWSEDVASRYGSEEELAEALASGAIPDSVWSSFFASPDMSIQEARAYGERYLRTAFRAQQRAEDEETDFTIAQGILATPDLSDEEGWVQDVVDAWTKDSVWGPESADVIERIARQTWRVASNEEEGVFADIAHTNALAAAALGQAEMYRMQGLADLTEAESAQALQFFESLGDITGVLEVQYKAAEAEKDAACGGPVGTPNSDACINARARLQEVGVETRGLLNLVFQQLGMAGAEEPLPMPSEVRGEFEEMRDQGIPLQDVIGANAAMAALYLPDLVSIWQDEAAALQESGEEITYTDDPEGEGAFSSLPALANAVIRGIAGGTLSAGAGIVNASSAAGAWITGGEPNAPVDWNPYNDPRPESGEPASSGGNTQGAQGSAGGMGARASSPPEAWTVEPPAANPEGVGTGVIARQGESSGNPAAIGESRTDGFAYGLYQFSTRQGTLAEFIESLPPRFKTRLNGAGGAREAAQGTERFQEEWRRLSQDPDFVAAQERFAQGRFIGPGLEAFENVTGLQPQNPVLREALIAASIQHDSVLPAIIERALEGRDPRTMSTSEIIQAIYDERLKTGENGELYYWRSSDEDTQESVRARLERERAELMAMPAARQRGSGQP